MQEAEAGGCKDEETGGAGRVVRARRGNDNISTPLNYTIRIGAPPHAANDAFSSASRWKNTW